jgi:hypothetical protein
LREQSARPVLGIAEAAVLTAMTMGQRFGIVSILSRSIPRHMRYLGAMGVLDRLAADLPLELGVADLASRDRTWDRLVEVGRDLTRARSGACRWWSASRRPASRDARAERRGDGGRRGRRDDRAAEPRCAPTTRSSATTARRPRRSAPTCPSCCRTTR